MRKYSKPAMMMEAFDIEDVITASGGGIDDPEVVVAGDDEDVGVSAPIDVMVDFN